MPMPPALTFVFVFMSAFSFHSIRRGIREKSLTTGPLVLMCSRLRTFDRGRGDAVATQIVQKKRKAEGAP
jgi:hypothetical protein